MTEDEYVTLSDLVQIRDAIKLLNTVCLNEDLCKILEDLHKQRETLEKKVKIDP